MAYRNSNAAYDYDLDYFETRVPAPRQVPKQQPAVAPKAVPSKKAQKRKRAQEEARLKAVFHMEIILVATIMLSLVAFVILGKVQTAEEVIIIGQREEQMATLISEKTRLETELEQLLPARTVEAYATKYLGMTTINDYQKNYVDTNAGEKVQISKTIPKTSAIALDDLTFSFLVGETPISGQ